MSVRRLAEPALQPASFAFKGARVDEAQRWVAKYPKGREQSAVIPLLMLAQEQEGWVTRSAIESIADMLAMPYIRALEVATFYTQFQLNPVGTRAHVQVCGTTPCMLRGAEDLKNVCRSRIHQEQFHTNADGTLSWEEVECLGACVNAPMVMIFKDTYEDLTPVRLGEIIDSFADGKGASVPVGPQDGRMSCAPAGGLTTLTSEADILKWAKERRGKIAAGSAPPPAAPGGSPPPAAPAAPASGATAPKAADTPKAVDAPKAAVAVTIPPSKAAKPVTHAAETNGAVKSPSPVKAGGKAEAASGASAPAYDKAAANKTEPVVEGGDARQRKGATASAQAAPFAAPELLKGKPVGAAGKPAKAVRPSLDHKNRPAGIERPAAVDDLKMISGIGPKNETILHSLGIYTFAQVAAWKKAERDWVDGYLNFHGRIEREEWGRQAKALAKGGVAEYIRVFGKKPV